METEGQDSRRFRRRESRHLGGGGTERDKRGETERDREARLEETRPQGKRVYQLAAGEGVELGWSTQLHGQDRKDVGGLVQGLQQRGDGVDCWL